MKSSTLCRIVALFFAGFLWTAVPAARAANTLNYQGRVLSGGTAFSGAGQFKFALVSSDGSAFYWKNDGATDTAAPATSVSLSVTKGLFSVRLGDTSFANMASISSSVLAKPSLALRIWFNDGTRGFQLLTPDQLVNTTSLSGSTSSADLEAKLNAVYKAWVASTSNVTNDEQAVFTLNTSVNAMVSLGVFSSIQGNISTKYQVDDYVRYYSFYGSYAFYNYNLKFTYEDGSVFDAPSQYFYTAQPFEWKVANPYPTKKVTSITRVGDVRGGSGDRYRSLSPIPVQVTLNSKQQTAGSRFLIAVALDSEEGGYTLQWSLRNSLDVEVAAGTGNYVDLSCAAGEGRVLKLVYTPAKVGLSTDGAVIKNINVMMAK